MGKNKTEKIMKNETEDNMEDEEKCCRGFSMKGGRSMEINRSTLMWIIIGILLVLVLFMTFSSSGGVGAAQAAGSAASGAQSLGMVGGC
jgi:hypothetical protein